jgi:hypothetical protein
MSERKQITLGLTWMDWMPAFVQAGLMVTHRLSSFSPERTSQCYESIAQGLSEELGLPITRAICFSGPMHLKRSIFLPSILINYANV